MHVKPICVFADDVGKNNWLEPNRNSRNNVALLQFHFFCVGLAGNFQGC